MKVKFLRTTWDLPVFRNLPDKKWTTALKKLKKTGYEGLEIAVQFSSAPQLEQFKKLKSEFEFEYISQIHTCGYPIMSSKVSDHVESLKRGIEAAMAINPNAINVHSGRDCWSIDQTLEYFRVAEQIQKGVNIPIHHETHRQRSLFTPYITQKVIQECPNIYLNADLSHWVLVGERFYSQETDIEFFDSLKAIKNNIKQIHSRIGTENQIQAIDPASNSINLIWYTHIWKTIVYAAEKCETTPIFYFTSEFGPFPYSIVNPKTGSEIGNSDKNNDFILKHVQNMITNLKSQNQNIKQQTFKQIDQENVKQQ